MTHPEILMSIPSRIPRRSEPERLAQQSRDFTAEGAPAPPARPALDCPPPQRPAPPPKPA